MPYTPPSHRSPASSASNSPDVSRRSSIASANGQRPSLPRSASYLNKHRRTPSAVSVNDAAAAPHRPMATLMKRPRTTLPPTLSARAYGSHLPASSGSEDEAHPEIRGRKLGKLREAVSQIPQPRTPSPTRQAADQPDDLTPILMRTSFSATSLDNLPKSGRRGHVRSATEPNAALAMLDSSPVSEDSDDDLKKKPQMVRKKSGELVRPALRPSSHRRPSSMPGTPVFAKAVHFDSHLEHIRHFLQVDRPLAVSAGSSPVENYDSDAEYPFPGGDKASSQRSPPFEWELVTNNFPHDSIARKDLPVRLEKVWLSPDQKSMLGSIAVHNLSFHKAVVCRFTLDYWKTTSEIVAEYNHEIRTRDSLVSQDRFHFSIKLSDTTNLESKTLFFCIRYTVNGQEFWDNNNMANFQVDFKKKHKAQNGKNNFQGASSRPANGLPRSNRRQNPSTVPRPISMPPTFDDFGKQTRFNFDDEPIHAYIGESGAPGGLRLKTKSTSNLASDNLTKGMTSPSGAAFANRYDFGASLNAAVQAAKDTVGKDKDAFAPQQVAPSPGVGLASSSYEELVSKYCFFGSKQSTPSSKAGTPPNGGYDGPKPDTAPSMPTIAARRTGPAMHHGLHLNNISPYMPAGTGSHRPSYTSPPKTMPASVNGKDQSSSPMAIGNARPRSPSVTVTGTSPNDRRFHLPQQVRTERFPWGGEPHATAIRG
ncbi:Protein phosphatase 1 regulatory subunit 3A [Cladobotryum mycophilum]|uniref:Protein phosphatase 1 regulatory subunit 3A n=1 Tax=Cladobotryum mycophilum TaxID=491253 RepID=A0ABR0SCT9_9HYPO